MLTKNVLGLFFMVLEHLEDCGRFCSFLGTLKVTPAKWPKRAKKVIQSFSKFYMSSVYSHMRLSTKSEENQRGEAFSPYI